MSIKKTMSNSTLFLAGAVLGLCYSGVCLYKKMRYKTKSKAKSETDKHSRQDLVISPITKRSFSDQLYNLDNQDLQVQCSKQTEDQQILRPNKKFADFADWSLIEKYSQREAVQKMKDYFELNKDNNCLNNHCDLAFCNILDTAKLNEFKNDDDIWNEIKHNFKISNNSHADIKMQKAQDLSSL